MPAFEVPPDPFEINELGLLLCAALGGSAILNMLLALGICWFFRRLRFYMILASQRRDDDDPWILLDVVRVPNGPDFGFAQGNPLYAPEPKSTARAAAALAAAPRVYEPGLTSAQIMRIGQKGGELERQPDSGMNMVAAQIAMQKLTSAPKLGPLSGALPPDPRNVRTPENGTRPRSRGGGAASAAKPRTPMMQQLRFRPGTPGAEGGPPQRCASPTRPHTPAIPSSAACGRPETPPAFAAFARVIAQRSERNVNSRPSSRQLSSRAGGRGRKIAPEPNAYQVGPDDE